LIGLVTAAPWLLGGVDPVVQVWLFFGVILALICWLLGRIADRSLGSVMPVAVVPLTLALGLGVFQLIPLGENTRAFFSPTGAELRNELLPTEAEAEGSLEEQLGVPAAPERQPLSLYPASTRNDLALLTLAVAVFVLGASLFKTPRAQIWLCGAIAANGAALAFFGLTQKITWDGRLYWNIPLEGGGSPFASFVNQNNAGGFLILCLAGAVGLTVWIVGRSGPSRAHPGRFPSPNHRPLLAQLRHNVLEFFSNLNAPTLAAMSLAGCIAAGILCSLSRGAGIAMIGATLVTITIVLSTRRHTVRVWSIALVAMAGLGLVSWVGMTDIVQARLATVFEEETVEEHPLIPHWGDGLKAVPDFWRLGSGLGTYRYVYGMHQQQPTRVWFEHAENQYLETFVEGGVVGFGLMLAMVALVGAAGWRLLRDDRDPRGFAFAIAAIFALGGQAVAGAFDFGLYMPANMMLFALLCGAVSGRAAELARRTSPGFLGLHRGHLYWPALAALLLVGAVLGCLEIRRVAAFKSATVFAKKHADFASAPDVSPEGVLASIQRVEAAVGQREDDAEALLMLARLQIGLYRLRVFDQLREEARFIREESQQAAGEGAEPIEDEWAGFDDESLWNERTPLTEMHFWLHQHVRDGRPDLLQEWRSDPIVEEHLLPALKNLVLARRCCPLLPHVHLRLAKLCGLVADPATDRIHLARLRRLVSASPELLYECGRLQLQGARPDLACESWQRCLAITAKRPQYAGYRERILRIAGAELETPGMIEKLLPESPGELIQLARERFPAEENPNVHRLLVERAEALIDRIELPQDEAYYLRGAVCELKGLYPQAIENYSRAVELRYQEAGWRYQLAQLLRREGMIHRAHREAVRCAQANPHKREYQELLEEINHTLNLARSSPR